MSLRVSTFSAEGYRSLRSIRLPTQALTVFVGANGVGKTNLYRALQLIQAAASGTLARDLAAEGGMESAHWAGVRRAGKPAQIRLGVELSPPGGAGAFTYDVTLGFPFPTAAAFAHEPQIKTETAGFRGSGRPIGLLERTGPRLAVRDEEGQRADIEADLMASETALSRLEDPSRYPDLSLIRQTLLDWRFYHDLRTDQDSPLRRPSLAVASPTLGSDGSNLAAVFATLAHIRGDTAELDRAIADAFPGARLEVPPPGRLASFGLVFPEYPKRVFEAGELSDGTLRYLGLMGALLAYRPPAFVALNEPESSLHPDLMAPLARLVARASQRTQIWLVTHSERLAAALADDVGVVVRTVAKRGGETVVEGLGPGGFVGDDED